MEVRRWALTARGRGRKSTEASAKAEKPPKAAKAPEVDKPANAEATPKAEKPACKKKSAKATSGPEPELAFTLEPTPPSPAPDDTWKTSKKPTKATKKPRKLEPSA